MKAPLTDHQLALLERIAQGTEPLTTSDSRLAVSVYALRSRHLVSTKGQRSYWSATITDEGRALLGRIPRSLAPAPPGPSDAARDRTAASLIAPGEVIRRVQDEGGVLRVTNPSPSVRAKWRRSIHAARETSVPDGFRLGLSGRDSGDLVIRLIRADAETEHPKPTAVQVPLRLHRPHPILRATRDVAQPAADGWIDTMRRPGVLHVRVTRQHFARVIRIANAIFGEAARRGHDVHTMARDRRCSGGAAVAIGGQHFELTFAEQTTRAPHVPTAAQAASEWSYAPRWDYIPTGRIVLRQGHTTEGKLAADGARWRLEDRLGHVFVELERLANELDERAAERARAERRRLEAEKLDWEEAMRTARSRLVEASRVGHLEDQIQRWEQASRIRAFVAKAKASYPDPDSVDPKTEEWLAWVGNYADTIDPMMGPLHMPDSPVPTPSGLAPFLNGWSPYAPTRVGVR